MNNSKLFIDYLAYISDGENQNDLVGNMFNVIQNNYKDIELCIFNKLFLEQLNASIKEKEETLHYANLLGTSSLIYDFSFNGKREVRNMYQVIKTLRYAAAYFEEAANQLSKPKLLFNFDNLPDYLNYEEVSQLTNWSKKTISTKHSKGELACVEGTGFTPKKGLFDYFEQRVKGIKDDPEKWFRENHIKKKK